MTDRIKLFVDTNLANQQRQYIDVTVCEDESESDSSVSSLSGTLVTPASRDELKEAKSAREGAEKSIKTESQLSAAGFISGMSFFASGYEKVIEPTGMDKHAIWLENEYERLQLASEMTRTKLQEFLEYKLPANVKHQGICDVYFKMARAIVDNFVLKNVDKVKDRQWQDNVLSSVAGLLSRAANLAEDNAALYQIQFYEYIVQFKRPNKNEAMLKEVKQGVDKRAQSDQDFATWITERSTLFGDLGYAIPSRIAQEQVRPSHTC